MSRLVLGAGIVVLGSFALIASGCSGHSVSPVDEVRAAQERSMAEESFAFEMTMETDIAGLGEAVEVTMSGESDLANGVMYMEMNALGLETEMVVADTAMYMRVTGFLGTDDKWISLDIEEIAGFSPEDITGASSGTDPSAFLANLAGISEDGVEDLGEEEIDGVEANHYRVEIDPQLAIEKYAVDDPEVAAWLEESLAEMDGTYVADLWIDEEGLIRRMSFEMDVMGDTAFMTMNFFDYGEPVEVTVPAEADVISMDEWMTSFGEMFEGFEDFEFDLSDDPALE